MLAALDTLIQIVLYGAIVTGFLMLSEQVWVDMYRWVRRSYYGLSHRQLLRISQGFRKGTKVKNDKFIEHLDILLKATLKKMGHKTVSRFILGSLIAMLVVFTLSVVASRRPLFSAAAALFTLLTPYVLLQIRRYQLSIANSYEIGILINRLVPEYRKQYGSMIHALQATAQSLPSGPIRRALVRLTDRLTNHVSTEEARRALDQFTRELGTTWAAQIANDIEHAVVDGVDVEHSLALLHKEFNDIEETRKGNNLARLDSLLVALAPFIFWPLLMLIFYLRLTRNIFYYQFGTPTGFEWFMLTFVATFGSFLIGITFYRPKQDI